LEHVGLFVLGLALLTVGAPLLVFGSARLDRLTGRSPFAVGAVAVCFGPCVAVLAFDLAAVLRQPPVTRLAVGHIVGSNVASIGLVLGAAALVRPVAGSAKLFRIAIPLAIGANLLFWFLARNSPLSRVDAGFLLAAAVVALVLLVRAARRESETVKGEFAGWVPERTTVWVAVLFALAGLASLVGGAFLTASELTGTAEHLALTKRILVLGDTIAAFGTALPAAVVAVLAARRGRSDLVLGVVVGPVIFNLLLTAALVAMLRPLVIDPPVIMDVIPVMALFALLLLPVLLNGLKVPRWEGAILLAAYAGFVTWQVLRVPTAPVR